MAKINGEDLKRGGKLVPFSDALKTSGTKLLNVLPVGLDPDDKKAMAKAMIFLTVKAYNEVPELRKCSPDSIINSLMDCASLGMMPFSKMNECAIIAYGGKATMQLMYRGIIKLCTNTGEYKNIRVGVVRLGDAFDYYKGLKQDLRHRASDVPSAKRPITHVYTLYELTNGGTDFEVMTLEDLIAHRDKYSKQYNYAKSKGKEKSAMWVKEFEGMAIKTVLIKLMKYAPKSDKLIQQLALDRDLKREIAPERKDFTDEKEAEFVKQKIADATGVYETDTKGMDNVNFEGEAAKTDQEQGQEESGQERDPDKGKKKGSRQKPRDSKTGQSGKNEKAEEDNGSSGMDAKPDGSNDIQGEKQDTTAVNEKQISRLFALGKKAFPEMSSEDFKAKVKEKFKLKSLREIVKFQYDQVCESLGRITEMNKDSEKVMKDFEKAEREGKI